ncbi:hypothetical protein [Streptomyces sp. TP-A0874]|uniref:hypothetical protein n=1 Tax=Streptomyces sp. TP-A0874 TaxID=549819 RepID=UPI000852ED60|nr:hypothetical protein [Streptomyces sp. TP-A0874]
MSLIQTLARMEAVATGRAQPAATVRHRHLSDRPLVLVPLATAGEAAAPLGALVGTDRERPRLLVVAQPRDRDLRSAFLAELADAVLPHLEGYAEEVETRQRKETDPETGEKVPVEVELCSDAPQLLVPGRAGVEFLRLLGRSTRFRRTAEEDPEAAYPAPAGVPRLGRWLTHYGERSRVPGSSLLLAVTELLGRHWTTGQSSPEDEHLGALLGWIDPPEGLSGAEAALLAECERGEDGLLCCPPAGPATDPVFDNRVLAPAMGRYDAARALLQQGDRAAGTALRAAEAEIRRAVAGQLRPTWEAVWRGVDLLRALPEAGHVVERWELDRWSYTHHRDRLRAGEPPQPKWDDAVTAARKLLGRETAQARLEAQEALDDPLVMAGHRLAGEAFAGRVVEVEMAYSASSRPMPRPLLTIRTEDRPQLSGDAKVFRALPDGRTQPGELVDQRPGAVVVRLTGGMGRGKVPEPGSVPEVGEEVCWTLFEHAPRGGPRLPEPEQTPWTHGGPPEDTALTGAPATSPDPVTAEDFL